MSTLYLRAARVLTPSRLAGATETKRPSVAARMRGTAPMRAGASRRGGATMGPMEQ